MRSSASSNRVRIASFVAVVLTVLLPAENAMCQLTSSKLVTIMPFISSEADSALAASSHAAFLLGIRTQNSGMIAVESERARELSRVELKEVVSDATSMGTYAMSSSSAFLVCGAIRTMEDGTIQFSLAFFGTDDRRILFTDMHYYESEEEAIADMPKMAREHTHSSNFTPADTPIMYSMIIPGIGQLALGETAHAVTSVGLVLAAITLSPMAQPEDPPWRKSQLRKAKTFYIAVAWAINVLDTFILIRQKMGKLDTRPFFSIVETANDSQGSVLRPIVGIKLKW